MRYREITLKKIEQLEYNFQKLKSLVSQGADVNQYFQTIENSEEMLSEIKSLIDREEITPNN